MGSPTATTYLMEVAAVAAAVAHLSRGQGLRPGILTSPISSHTTVVTHCRAGEQGSNKCTHGLFSVDWLSDRECCACRLGLVDPDLPPPGPPTMRSFKVGGALQALSLPASLVCSLKCICVRVQEFLLNMEDSVDETEAVKRYNQYKLDFRRQQLQDFFLQHKDQEWFRSKYHPDDISSRKGESLAALKTRLGVFLFLLENNWLDNVSLDMDHAPAIIKLLDAGMLVPIFSSKGLYKTSLWMS